MPSFELITPVAGDSAHFETLSTRPVAVVAGFSTISVKNGALLGKELVPRLDSGEACVGAHSEMACSSCAGGSARNIMVSPLTGDKAVGESLITVPNRGVGNPAEWYKKLFFRRLRIYCKLRGSRFVKRVAMKSMGYNGSYIPCTVCGIRSSMTPTLIEGD